MKPKSRRWRKARGVLLFLLALAAMAEAASQVTHTPFLYTLETISWCMVLVCAAFACAMFAVELLVNE